MRFRGLELFLGMFLAVAIFAVGILFASSWPNPKQSAQPATSEQSQKHSEEAKTPDAELTGSTWFTKDAAGFFTFWLVVVGAAQAILFYVQLHIIRASLDDAKTAADAAKEAADATKESVVLARNTAEKQLRAYVLVTNITIVGVEPGATPKADIIFRNSGQTPAYDVEVTAAMGLIDYPPTSEPIDDEPSAIGSVVVLGPQSEYRVPATLIGQLGSDQFIAILDGSQAIHIIGTIMYRDAFGIARHTNFSSFYGGKFGTNDYGAPSHAPTGNDAT